MDDTDFRLLGPVGIWHAGRLLGPSAAQQRSVLAMLLLAPGRVVPLDRLVMAVWDQCPPKSARNALQVQISKLRRILEPADLCQSILKSFFVRAASGQFDLDSPEKLLALLRTMAAEGRTILFSSHILEEVERVADSVLVVYAGRLAAAGDFRSINCSMRWNSSPSEKDRLI